MPPEYFYLPYDGGDGIYRERVYCYELYHQLRSRWPEDTDYRLTGEVDKISHPILAQFGADRKKPALLVHRPGAMDNYAIIEVKFAPPTPKGVKKDLETLALFISSAGYGRGIYLIYGDDANDGHIASISRLAEPIIGESKIELWFHVRAGLAARQVQELRGAPLALSPD